LKKYLIGLLALVFLSFLTSCSNDEEKGLYDTMNRVHINSPYDHQMKAYTISYRSDGQEVEGFILKPKKIKTKAPLILFNHGGINGKGIITDKGLRLLSFWSAKGYVVVGSQYRSNGKPEHANDFGQNDLRDSENLLNLTKKISYLDRSRIYMMGFSRGGMVTYMLLKHHPEIKAATVISGVSSTYDLYKDSPPYIKSYLKETLGTRKENPEGYKRRSAIYWAKDIQTPILLIHATMDPTVPFTQAEQMASELEKNNKEYRLVQYPSKLHRLTDYRTQFQGEALSWFNEHEQSEKEIKGEKKNAES
jgi:dipeptidyl aminopeptidase/acylaminoacyl peptidase